MKIAFDILGISGKEMATVFQAAIETDSIGFDEMASAQLVNKTTWVTAWSGFTYTIANPTEAEPAVILYDGAARGFLAQNLLPCELHGENSKSLVTEGSALSRHGMLEFEHTNAKELAEAYGLMQGAQRAYDYEEGSSKLDLAILAVKTAREINDAIEKNGIEAWARSANMESGSACSNTRDGDPCIVLTCSPCGEQVRKEMQANESERAKKWLFRLKEVGAL